MKAFKLFRVQDGQLVSDQVEGAAKVAYKKEHDNVAPIWLAEHGYHLLVFQTIRDVLIYLSVPYWIAVNHHDVEIWEVEVDEVIDQLPKRVDFSSLGNGRLTNLNYSPEWPPGTIMVKTVKLLQPVERAKIR